MARRIELMETRALNVYDVLRLGDGDTVLALGEEFGMCMFGYANVGVPYRTNLQVPGQLACDQEGHIVRLYARTNLPDSAAFRAWAHTTIVDFIIGDRPVAQAHLSELMRLAPKSHLSDKESDLVGRFTFEGGRLVPIDGNPHGRLIDWLGAARERELEKLGLELCKAYTGAAFASPDDRERWLAVARAAKEQLAPDPIIVVPVRQNVSVRVKSEERALRTLLEDVPRDLNPEPLVWIHLEGFSRRHVQ